MMNLIKVFCVYILLGINVHAQVNSNQIGLVTGPKQGKYYKFGSEFAEIINNGGLKFSIKVKPSINSVANIYRLIGKENASMAILQSDILDYLISSNDPQFNLMAEKLRLIAPLYNKTVHVLANTNITKISDLNKENIVVGERGSDSWLTMTNLIRIKHVKPKRLLYLTTVQGITAVLSGRAAAMIYVSEIPVNYFERFSEIRENPKFKESIANVHLLNLDDEEILNHYQLTTITSDDYRWIEQDIKTLSVPVVLASFDFSKKNSDYYTLRCSQITKISETLNKEIPSLKTNNESVWSRVDLNQSIPKWKMAHCDKPDKIQEVNKPLKKRKNDFRTLADKLEDLL